MKRLIYRYLDRKYSIRDRMILDSDGLTIYNRSLVDELKEVFGLTLKQLKPYVRDWARSKDRNFDFKAFWKKVLEKWQWNFPMVSQVQARTVAMDLVSVQPMGAPVGNLVYFDHNYVGGVDVAQAHPRPERLSAVNEMMRDWGLRVF